MSTKDEGMTVSPNGQQTDVSRSTLFWADCFDVFPLIADKSVDMILCDLPYGTTQNKYDIMLPFDKLREQYERIIKDNGAIVLFGQGLFFVQIERTKYTLHKSLLSFTIKYCIFLQKKILKY